MPLDSDYLRLMLDTFEKARPHLEAALEKSIGTHSIYDIRDAVIAGDMQLWTSENTAAVTEVIDYPQKRTVLVRLAGGDRKELEQTVPALEEFARKVKADYILVGGRRGWVKTLAPKGFEECETYVVKEVGNV